MPRSGLRADHGTGVIRLTCAQRAPRNRQEVHLRADPHSNVPFSRASGRRAWHGDACQSGAPVASLSSDMATSAIKTPTCPCTHKLTSSASDFRQPDLTMAFYLGSWGGGNPKQRPTRSAPSGAQPAFLQGVTLGNVLFAAAAQPARNRRLPCAAAVGAMKTHQGKTSPGVSIRLVGYQELHTWDAPDGPLPADGPVT